MRHTHKPGTVLFLFAIIAVVAAALWPESPPPALEGAAAEPFTWDRAEMFGALERDFQNANADDAAALFAELDAALALIRDDTPPTAVLPRIEELQFRLSAIAAAKPELLGRVREAFTRVRATVLTAARGWSTGETSVHAGLYRVIFGGRAALEEALVQAGADALDPLSRIADVPSETPAADVQGVRVHSGDIVLTRGGAPTSALIARGNDFPGNFSHAALVHVDESGTASVIEALIEHGLVVSTLEHFLEDKKLRILLLRPRPDVVDDPMMPHRAASEWLRRAREDGLGYDFAMDWSDESDVFCSEVVYHAYRGIGVELWGYRSTISSPGLVRWLGTLGVRNFVTLVPSDLEYDPQLAAVAEWRHPEELRRDRRDNAIIDALLEEAERGANLSYAWYQLPAARALKAWSVVVDTVGGTPTIPAGMSGATAARINGLRHEIFEPLRDAVAAAEESFHAENGYEAPYWQLVALARAAVAEHREQMAPALSPPTPD